MEKTSLSLESAVELLLQTIPAPRRREELPLLSAAGRPVCEDLFARHSQPPFDRSPLDGYALRHEDTASASEERPAVLRVVRCIYAGDPPGEAIGPEEAVRLMTGAPLPPGATCVVRQEDTDQGEEQVAVYTPLKKHENYVFRGEDVREGQLLISKGALLDAGAVGVLAGQGYPAVPVFARPTAGILSTGSELVAAGEPLKPGKIYDSNRYTLAVRAKALGAEVVMGASTADDPRELARGVADLLGQSDLVITTGGVSVGKHDYMPKVGRLLGARELFHGVACKPGSPALALEKDGKLVLCLSGNPFAAAATFDLLAGPVLRKLAGWADPLPKRVRAALRGGFPKKNTGRRFLRAYIAGGEVFAGPEGHASGTISSFAGCNCLIDIPAGTSPLQDGDAVEVVLL